MPLILAVNPAGLQSPTLARLARELKGCELIGAESYAVAIQALDQHAPDLVLLPGTYAMGEGELLARLSAAPRLIPTLKLPPPAATDFNALLADVKAHLAGPVDIPPIARAGASPQLLAAAAAAIAWVRERRETWTFEDVQTSPLSYTGPALAPTGPDSDAPPAPEEQPAGPSVFSRAADAAGRWREVAAAWLPRLAVPALVIAIVSVGVFFWPNAQRAWMSALTSFNASRQPVEPVESAPAPAPSAQQVGRSNAPAASEPSVSGWLAVFSPFDLSISEGNRSIVLDDRSRAMLPPGSHKLRFRNPELGYDEVRTVQIRPTETTTLNLIPQTTLSVTSNEPAEVLIDGTPAGQTPLVGHRVDVGLHTVLVRSGNGEREFTLEATTKPLQIDVDFSVP